MEALELDGQDRGEYGTARAGLNDKVEGKPGLGEVKLVELCGLGNGQVLGVLGEGGPALLLLHLLLLTLLLPPLLPGLLQLLPLPLPLRR